ncbi:TolC family protein [Labilithrix luteola]|uniref:TolC family protein n=1 Tax=Labilithrix luteola TaxID=1391654 RepID=UPI0011BABA4E|nr:TolC family protein [Labilithrix luteola]
MLSLVDLGSARADVPAPSPGNAPSVSPAPAPTTPLGAPPNPTAFPGSRSILNEQAPIPPGAQHLPLSEAVKVARSRAFDVLLAATDVKAAEGDVRAAGPLPNPTLSAYVGRVFNYSPNVPGCEGCSHYAYFAELSDQGLIEGAISRKRALRKEVAKYALTAARLGKTDAERIVIAQAKIQYMQAAAAQVQVEFTRDVAASLERSVEINRVRYPRVIDEGQLARVEQEAMRAEQDVERARRAYRQEQIDLAVLLGMQGPVPELAVDRDVLRFRVPEVLQSPDNGNLLQIALENRPDRKQAIARESGGEAAVTLAKRSRIPDISLLLQYQQAGTGQSAVQPPTLSVGAALPLPVFYQQQGEIGRAEAEREAASVARKRVETTVAAEIASAHNAFVTARAIVERYESSLLERAKRAREITQVQYNAGSATLTDLLDAQRSWVQVNSDYNAELVNYWAAVFMLEQAIGKELTQ